jgi:hypothetical protein
VREGRDEAAEVGAGEGGGGGSIEKARKSQGNHRGGREVVRSKENQRDRRKEDGLFDVRKKIVGFFYLPRFSDHHVLKPYYDLIII